MVLLLKKSRLTVKNENGVTRAFLNIPLKVLNQAARNGQEISQASGMKGTLYEITVPEPERTANPHRRSGSRRRILNYLKQIRCRSLGSIRVVEKGSAAQSYEHDKELEGFFKREKFCSK